MAEFFGRTQEFDVTLEPTRRHRTDTACSS
jgi:hypothetical protein